jgi:hypothetical protein
MKNLELALLVTLIFTILIGQSVNAQTTVTIGSGTTTNYNLPIDSYYGYTYSQQIFLQSEINTTGTISELRFYMVGGVSLSNSNTWVVYMGHTSKTSFSSTTDWISVSGLTQVFSGDISSNPSAGWYTITLSTPFLYNNTDNLVIAVDENKASYNGQTNYCRIFTPSGSNRAIYYRDDSSNPNPASPPTATGRQSNINQIQLLITPSGPMQYSSSTTETASTNTVYAGYYNNEIIRLNVVTTGSSDPISATSITFNTNGSTSAGDISSAKVYYTTNTSFSTTTQFGTATVNPNGTFTVTGTQQLISGNNYFWLAYDISINSTSGNVVDGECTSVTVAGSPYTPTVTAPSGSRIISFATVLLNATLGTTSASYTKLYDAVAKINDGTHRGSINIYIGADITETSDISLNASGSGSANYTSVRIQPCGGASRTISKVSSSSNGMFMLNGADNITIDGLNTGGNSLTFINTYNSNSPVISLQGTSSSDYSNNNTITNCNIKGNNEGANYGCLSIYNYVSNLTISNCNITSATPASYHPTSLIRSYGVNASYPNSNITITGNNLYDYGCYYGGYAVNLYQYTTGCNISSNRIYQPSSLSFSGNCNYYGIYIGGGSGHTINGNIIGFANSSGTGTSSLSFGDYTKSFMAICLYTDNSTSSTINSNIISGFSITYSTNLTFYGIFVEGCNSTSSTLTVEVSNNTVGSSTSENAIVFNESSDCRLDILSIDLGGFTSGYRFAGTISSNVIGGINTGTTYVPYQVYFYGIVGSGNNASNFTISGNSIGYSSAPLRIGNSATSAIWKFNGIYLAEPSSSQGPGYTVSNNVINYITNYSTYSSAELNGIYNNQTTCTNTKTISGNTISDLTGGYKVYGINNPNNYTRYTIISGNTLKNLNAGDDCFGINFYACNFNNVVSSNFISRLSTTNTSKAIYGLCMNSVTTEGNSVYNNIISLGKNSAGSDLGNILIYGIWDNGYLNYYYNTVSITGAVTSSTQNTYCFYGDYNNYSISIKDNIFTNLRTNSSGTASHYAIRLYSSSSLTINYNDYYVSGTGGKIGYYYNSDKTTLADWKAATGQDVNSISTNPTFSNSTGTLPNDYMPSAVLSGITISGITTDYNGAIRSGTPAMGALEGTYYLWTGGTSTNWETTSNWSTNAVPTSGQNIIIKTGATYMPVTASSLTVGTLELQSGTALTLGADMQVNGTLVLSSGLITLGNYNLTLGGSSSISGTPSATNMIIATSTGELRKTFTGTGSFTFPVGDNTSTVEYSPITLNFTSGTFSSAYAGVTLGNSKYSNNSSVTDYLNRYWTVNQSGISDFSCDVTAQYLVADVVGTESSIYAGKYNSSWTILNQADAVNHRLTGTVTGFSTFTGGQQGVMPVEISAFNSSVIGRDVKLNWVTSSEKNNAGFEIQKSVQNSEWNKIGYINGNGTKNTPTNYNFTDSKLNMGKYKYRLKQIDNNGNFEYHILNNVIEIGVPTKFSLSQNYPNPFNPKTKIDFQIPNDAKVTMKIYDVSGREIATLLNSEYKKADYYTLDFNATNIASGIYFYRITTDKFIDIKKMVLIK